jgi:hypothetical protein
MFTNLTTLGQASAGRRSAMKRSASEFAVGMVLSLRKGKGSPGEPLGGSCS